MHLIEKMASWLPLDQAWITVLNYKASHIAQGEYSWLMNYFGRLVRGSLRKQEKHAPRLRCDSERQTLCPVVLMYWRLWLRAEKLRNIG